MFVLDEALRQCRTWLLQGLELCVAVNLSTRNLLDLHLPEAVAELLARWEVPAGLLELEITESTILADPVRAMQILSRLDEMGVRLSIDDFGTGYSSLAYLKRLPVDELKIDKSFILGHGRERERRGDRPLDHRPWAEPRSARGCRGRRVAAGMEPLAQLGCNVAQGYFLSRPVPAEQLTQWLADRAGRRRLRSA